MKMIKESILFSVMASMLMVGCSQSVNQPAPTGTVYEGEKIEKTADQWRKDLSEEEYYILREQGTERAFSGEFWDHKGDGAYICGACQLPLFSSDTKYKSGTGWPSFFEPIKQGHVGERSDNSHGWTRVEVVCNRCEGHLGHVFEDGPEPTGLRYCINSASLDFEPSRDAE